MLLTLKKIGGIIMKQSISLSNNRFIKVILVISILILQLTTMSSYGYCSDTSVNLTGRYYWELVFSYDNTNNSGTIVDQFTYQKETKIDTTTFRQSTIKRNEIWDYSNKTNFKISWKVINVSTDLNYSYHLEASKELVEKFTENIVTTTSESRTRTYTIGAGSKLNLYRLVYSTVGMTIKTDIFSTVPLPANQIIIQYTVQESILGFDKLSSTLLNTFPGRDNKAEWATIRNSIISSSHKDEIEQFRDLVKTMSGISPGRDNKAEWANIRVTCNEILSDWDSYTKQRLLNKLLFRLSSTRPGSRNCAEWATIRKATTEILNNLTLN